MYLIEKNEQKKKDKKESFVLYGFRNLKNILSLIQRRRLLKDSRIC